MGVGPEEPLWGVEDGDLQLVADETDTHQLKGRLVFPLRDEVGLMRPADADGGRTVIATRVTVVLRRRERVLGLAPGRRDDGVGGDFAALRAPTPLVPYWVEGPGRAERNRASVRKRAYALPVDARCLAA